MRVLIIHCYYLQSGGEDAVFKQEEQLLKQNNEVDELIFANKLGVKGVLQFLLSIWNVFAAHTLQKKIRTFKPDVIHIHNWHFASGPIIIRTARRNNVPVVLTLHNYRLLCPSGVLLFKDKIFTDSIKSAFPWKAVRYKVYKNSRSLTFWLAFVIWVHKKLDTWQMVSKYIVLTKFAKDVFIQSSFGVPPQKFIVKPNFVVTNTASVHVQRGKHFLFVGRLSSEKGIHVLLDAFQHSNYDLQIIGDGPLRDDVMNICKKNPNIKYKGSLTKEFVLKAMSECTALIFPSIWYEGMPMTLLESFASGTPVIASRLGAMESMINNNTNGLFFDPGNSQSLLTQVEYWDLLNAEEKERFRKSCIVTYHLNYTPEESLGLLNNIYKELLIGQAAQ